MIPIVVSQIIFINPELSNVNINLNHKGKALNQNFNVKEYILIGYNHLKEQEAVTHLRNLIQVEKAHLLPYANNVIYRNNLTDTVIHFEDKTGTAAGMLGTLSRKLTHH